VALAMPTTPVYGAVPYTAVPLIELDRPSTPAVALVEE